MNQPIQWTMILAMLSVICLGTMAGCESVPRQIPSYNKGYQPKQPIPFSHKKHAGELNIDCKYCHTGAEKSRHATIPSVNICLNCHKVVKTDSPHIKKIHAAAEKGTPIPWIRIHKLPDFVHFDHSRHVNRGVRCQTCHGEVEEMEELWQQNTLSMGWCVNCHRKYKSDPPARLKERKLRPSIDCGVCHY